MLHSVKTAGLVKAATVADAITVAADAIIVEGTTGTPATVAQGKKEGTTAHASHVMKIMAESHKNLNYFLRLIQEEPCRCKVAGFFGCSPEAIPQRFTKKAQRFTKIF